MFTANVRILSARIALAAGMVVSSLGYGLVSAVELHAAPAAPAHPTVSVAACEEDQPCWDCTTMGNRICGVDVGGPAYAPGTGPAVDAADDALYAAGYTN